MDTHSYGTVHAVEQQHWFFLGRRAIAESLLNHARGVRILDVGCGTGGNIEFLRDHGQVIGIDIARAALDFCSEQSDSPLAQADGQMLPFRDASFDYVVALDVIEHLPDDQGALCDFVRVLKPRGKVIIFTPAFKFLWGALDDVAHHQRRYTAPVLRERLERAGLRINKLSYANSLLFTPVLLARQSERFIKGRDPEADLKIPPAPLNRILAGVFAFEAQLIRRFNLPVGVSLVCVAERP